MQTLTLNPDRCYHDDHDDGLLVHVVSQHEGAHATVSQPLPSGGNEGVSEVSAHVNICIYARAYALYNYVV